jgi:uncharacterized protein (UPF0332 family)
VKEQTGAFLDKSRELLDEANAILSINLHEAAARAAYMPGFHAAQAFIFESSGRIYKTHSGVQGEFARLVKDDARVDDQIRAFLGRSYNLKSIADYQTGPGSHISAESAREAINAARRFIECVAGLVPTPHGNLSLAERFGRPATPEAEAEPDHEPEDDLEP